VEIIITDNADEEMGNMGSSTRIRFDKHILKIATKRPTRFFKDHNIVQVGDQGRIIFQVDLKDDVLYILRCFSTHKDYEKWYHSLRHR